jgi:hypothetical protein
VLSINLWVSGVVNRMLLACAYERQLEMHSTYVCASLPRIRVMDRAVLEWTPRTFDVSIERLKNGSSGRHVDVGPDPIAVPNVALRNPTGLHRAKTDHQTELHARQWPQ